MLYFTTARICLNGHIIAYDISNHETTEPFCSQCGAPTIIACPSCNAPIKGIYYDDLRISPARRYCSSFFCHACGEPFPWTKADMDETMALISMSDTLTEEEKNQLNTLFPNLFTETPRTISSAITASSILSTASPILIGALKASIGDKIVTSALKFLGW